jgi:hypothetical protein
MSKSENNLIKIDRKKDGAVGFVLFLGFIGAAVYFVNQVDGFWNIVVALQKAIVWPAVLIYNLLQSFSA